MEMTIGTIRAYPMHLSAAVWGNVNIAQVCIFGMVPLLLQLWAEQADVWTLLLFGLPFELLALVSCCCQYQQTRQLVLPKLCG